MLFKKKQSTADFCYQICENIIDGYYEGARYPYGKEDVLLRVKEILDNSKSDLASMPASTDWDELCIENLYDVTFALVTSGKYHLRQGVLNQTGEGVRGLAHYCLHLANKRGLIDEQTLNEQLSVVDQSIRNVG